MRNPAGEGGAAGAIRKDLDGPRDIAHHAAPPQVPPLDRHLADRRFERAVVHVHQLGPRAIGELLREITLAHGLAGDIEARLAHYARLDPEIVRAMGWDHFPPRPIHLVAGRP